jgi:hypothetical protein
MPILSKSISNIYYISWISSSIMVAGAVYYISMKNIYNSDIME